eukprot:m.81210 g.81210  ORF g.81210 m.81210 type:complete len:435 (+) comp14239_c0_seq2:2378-3682(+)
MASVLRNFPRIVTVEQAASELVKSNARIVTAMAVSEPHAFFSQLEDFVQDRENVQVYCANPNRAYNAFRQEGLQGKLSLTTMFLTNAVRNLQGHGVVFYAPHNLRDWGPLLCRKPVDVFWGTCTPPNEKGYVSLGPSAVYEAEALLHAKKVVLEVNPKLPFCHGATAVRVSDIDYLIEPENGASTDILTEQRKSYDEVDQAIAANVATLIPNGATLQFGIGGIPNALAQALSNHRDLGVHTEMINDAVVDLAKAGIVTGNNKSQWERQMVGAFALGSKELYEYIDNHPGVIFLPGSIVNDIVTFGRNRLMFSVNTCVELDLTGQVCSESVGHRELSGVGGAADTHIGAQRSPGGRAIIALRSINKKGTSKIVHELMPGAKVSITRNDVDTVVTEYGIAELKGCNTAERCKALISIAHPSVRDELTEQAKKHCYL